MRKLSIKILFLYLAFLSIFAFPLHAGYLVEAETTVSEAFDFPRTDYVNQFSDKAFRNHLLFHVDANLLGFAGSNYFVSMGFSFGYNYKSNTYNSIMLRPFSHVGVNVNAKVLIFEKWNAGIVARLLLAQYEKTKERFVYTELEPYAAYTFYQRATAAIDLVIPVSVAIRNDIISISPGIGFSVRFFK